MNVQQMLNEGKLSNKFEIKFSSATDGIFVLDDKINPCHLVELPCVIESQKSFDTENFYKSADIHQMIIVTVQRKGNKQKKNKTQQNKKQKTAEEENHL